MSGLLEIDLVGGKQLFATIASNGNIYITASCS